MWTTGNSPKNPRPSHLLFFYIMFMSTRTYFLLFSLTNVHPSFQAHPNVIFSGKSSPVDCSAQFHNALFPASHMIEAGICDCTPKQRLILQDSPGLTKLAASLLKFVIRTKRVKSPHHIPLAPIF